MKITMYLLFILLSCCLLSSQQETQEHCNKTGGQWESGECLWKPHYRPKAEAGRLNVVDVMKADLFEGYPDMSIITDTKTKCEWIVADGRGTFVTLIPNTCKGN
jgi:hypothetical protein